MLGTDNHYLLFSLVIFCMLFEYFQTLRTNFAKHFFSMIVSVMSLMRYAINVTKVVNVILMSESCFEE